jgi:hypothetical protein
VCCPQVQPQFLLRSVHHFHQPHRPRPSFRGSPSVSLAPMPPTGRGPITTRPMVLSGLALSCAATLSRYVVSCQGEQKSPVSSTLLVTVVPSPPW